MTRWTIRAAAVAAALGFAVPALACSDMTTTKQEQPKKKQAVASNAPAKAPAKTKAAKGT